MTNYYISDEGTTSPARVVKRLRDFKGTHGKRYTVRTRRKVDMMDYWPTYVGLGTVLVKTDSGNLLWGVFE
jgi:hypothetical protein